MIILSGAFRNIPYSTIIFVYLITHCLKIVWISTFDLTNNHKWLARKNPFKKLCCPQFAGLLTAPCPNFKTTVLIIKLSCLESFGSFVQLRQSFRKLNEFLDGWDTIENMTPLYLSTSDCNMINTRKLQAQS